MVLLMKRINADDVARLAGVSKATVSRAFAPSSSISADKKARVFDAAGKLGYQPNALARSLRTTRSNLVGIILEEFTNPFFLRILELMTRKLQDNGLHAITINAAKDITVGEATDLVMQYRIDGLIVSSDIPLEIEHKCALMKVPVIIFARSDKRTSGAFSVCLDDEAVGRLAARHLVQRGYRAPAFIGGFPGVTVSLNRQNGFRDGLAESGLVPIAIEYAGDNTYDLGYAAGRRLLAAARRPDSVFCVNDQVAVGLMDAATEAGMSVPNELGVIGVDDIWMARAHRYSITTISQPLEAMADKVIDFLISTEPGPPREPALFEGTLIERGSTRPAVR